LKIYCVYILRSLSTKRLYIGQTNDFDRRFQEHSRGKHPATRNRGPWELLYLLPCSDRKEAVCLERKLKNMKRPDRVLKYVEKLV
jgi:predicted GIY-YIG superfamily endonuclease